MGHRGFTLLELVIVMAIAGILLALSNMNFSGMETRGAMEKQVRTMYADLMTARSQALYQKTTRYVQVTATGYAIFPTSDTTAAPLLRTAFKYPVIFNPTDTFYFDYRGVANLQAGSMPETICIDPNDPNILTSVVISETSIKMGKISQGGSCGNAATIVFQ